MATKNKTEEVIKKTLNKVIQQLVDYMEPTDYDDIPKYDSEREIKDELRRNNMIRRDSIIGTGSNDYSQPKFQKNPSGHMVSNIVKKHYPDIDSFMRVAKFLFLNADWSENYGGKNWASIVDGYFKLKSASNKNQLIIARF